MWCIFFKHSEWPYALHYWILELPIFNDKVFDHPPYHIRVWEDFSSCSYPMKERARRISALRSWKPCWVSCCSRDSDFRTFTLKPIVYGLSSCCTSRNIRNFINEDRSHLCKLIFNNGILSLFQHHFSLWHVFCILPKIDKIYQCRWYHVIKTESFFEMTLDHQSGLMRYLKLTTNNLENDYPSSSRWIFINLSIHSFWYLKCNYFTCFTTPNRTSQSLNGYNIALTDA